MPPKPTHGTVLRFKAQQGSCTHIYTYFFAHLSGGGFKTRIRRWGACTASHGNQGGKTMSAVKNHRRIKICPYFSSFCSINSIIASSNRCNVVGSKTYSTVCRDFSFLKSRPNGGDRRPLLATRTVKLLRDEHLFLIRC